MLDLKVSQDAVFAADAALKAKAAEIAGLLEMGTEEATQQALALQESLDKLQTNYDASLKLYDGLKKANSPSDVAQNFVPVSNTSPTPEAEKPKGVMKRVEFEALKPNARLAFSKAGGKLED